MGANPDWIFYHDEKPSEAEVMPRLIAEFPMVSTSMREASCFRQPLRHSPHPHGTDLHPQLGPQTMVVLVADGADWIWRRAWIFPRRCEIPDYWQALEKAWAFARVQYGEGCWRAEAWFHRLAHDLKAGKVQAVIRRLERLQPRSAEARKCLAELIDYYRDKDIRTSRILYNAALLGSIGEISRHNTENPRAPAQGILSF